MVALTVALVASAVAFAVAFAACAAFWAVFAETFAAACAVFTEVSVVLVECVITRYDTLLYIVKFINFFIILINRIIDNCNIFIVYLPSFILFLSCIN